VPALLQAAGVFVLIAWLAHGAVLSDDLPTPLAAELWLVLLAALVAARAAARTLLAGVAGPERCLLIGGRGAIEVIARKLQSSPNSGAEVVAAVQMDHAAARSDDALATLVDSHRIQRLILAPDAVEGADALDLIRLARGLGVRVSVVPRLLEAVGSSLAFDDVDGMTMLGVRRFGLSPTARVLKRGLDFAVASVMLIALAPLLLLVSLAVRLDSRGPVLFRQTRVGRDGRHFEILKFRTMVLGADQRKQDLWHLNEADGFFKMQHDPRVTRLGRMLRSTSLDELPQLVNVWRGEMSLVGPRPLVVDEDARITGLDRSRLQLTPGITGPWQILGSSRIPLREMVGIDYLYATNWSPWSDVNILLRTVPHVLSRRGM